MGMGKLLPRCNFDNLTLKLQIPLFNLLLASSTGDHWLGIRGRSGVPYQTFALSSNQELLGATKSCNFFIVKGGVREAAVKESFSDVQMYPDQIRKPSLRLSGSPPGRNQTGQITTVNHHQCFIIYATSIHTNKQTT